MSAQAWQEVHEQANEMAGRLHRLARFSERLSPVWELYVRGILQPMHFFLVQEAYGQGGSQWEERMKDLRKSVLLHPFNLSDDRVNLNRAKDFIQSFANRDRTVGVRKSARQKWWTQDAEALVEAIKKEREEMDAYGCIARGGRERGKGEEGATAATITKAEDEAPPTKRQRTS